MGKKLSTAVCVAIASLACLSLPTAASATTLEGACDLTGTLTYVAAQTFAPAANPGYRIAGSAMCTGTLDSAPIADRVAELAVTSNPYIGACQASLSDGNGTMTFVNGVRDNDPERPLDDPDDTILRFGMGAVQAGTEFGVELVAGGYAFGTVTTRDQATTAFAQCVSGLGSVSFAGGVETASPLES